MTVFEWAADATFVPSGDPTKVSMTEAKVKQGFLPDTANIGAEELNWYLNQIADNLKAAVPGFNGSVWIPYTLVPMTGQAWITGAGNDFGSEAIDTTDMYWRCAGYVPRNCRVVSAKLLYYTQASTGWGDTGAVNWRVTVWGEAGGAVESIDDPGEAVYVIGNPTMPSGSTFTVASDEADFYNTTSAVTAAGDMTSQDGATSIELKVSGIAAPDLGDATLGIRGIVLKFEPLT